MEKSQLGNLIGGIIAIVALILSIVSLVEERNQTESLNVQGELHADTIVEFSSDSGVTIEGIVVRDSELYVSVINQLSDSTAATINTGVTVGGVLLKSSSVYTSNINESTSNSGVFIDGVHLKDSKVFTDTINEKTLRSGVTIDGVTLKDSEIYTDTINEKSSNTGVTVDGVLLKDHEVSANVINEFTADSGVYVDGVHLYNTQVFADDVYITSSLNTDTINEENADAGVTIDGVTIMDGGIILENGLTNLNYYNTTTTTATFSGPFQVNRNITLYVTRLGRIVTVSTFTYVSTVCGSPGTSTYIRANSLIPSWAIPDPDDSANPVKFLHIVYHLNTFTYGTVEITSTGELRIYKDVINGVFTANDTSCGFAKIDISYTMPVSN